MASSTPLSRLAPSLRRPGFRVLGLLGCCALLFGLALLTPASTVPVAVASSEVSGDQVAQCRQLSLPAMGWARGGAFAPDGSLWLLDLLEQDFVRLAPSSGDFERVYSEGSWNHPASIKQRGSEVLVYDHGRLAQVMDGPRGEIKSLNGTFAKGSFGIENRRLDRLVTVLGPDAELKTIYDWHPVGDGVLAFGDIKLGDTSSWISAFVYLDPEGGQQVFRTLPTHADAFNQYSRNTAYVTAVGEAGFVLFLGENPIIGRLEPGVEGVRYLPEFPEDFRHRPLLKTNQKWARSGQGARQATHFYEILERSTMAAGLYASSTGGLFLLGKEAMAADGTTAWWMIRLDPSDGSEVSRVRLPTQAAHLDVIFGEDRVALVEKSGVQGVGELNAPYMNTQSVVLLPTTWVESDTGQLPRDGSSCPPLAS